MTALQAVILGVVQGLTELLPVSSSAHLVIAQSFMTEFHQPGVLFDAVLHVGTLFSVIYFFRNDIVSLAISILPGLSRRTVPEEQQKAFRKVAGLILISTAITVLIGFIFKDRIEILFSSVTVAASMLFVTGFFLFLSDWKKHIEKNEENLSVPGAALIGLIQAAALVPGISRSGSTIVCGIFLGLRREAAARYSFLLSVPAILGAVQRVNGSPMPWDLRLPRLPAFSPFTCFTLSSGGQDSVFSPITAGWQAERSCCPFNEVSMNTMSTLKFFPRCSVTDVLKRGLLKAGKFWYMNPHILIKKM